MGFGFGIEDWGLGLGIGDWGLGLGLGIVIGDLDRDGIRDWNWELGIRFVDWDWDWRLEIGD